MTEFQSFADARARELRKAYDQIRKESVCDATERNVPARCSMNYIPVLFLNLICLTLAEA